ncbi:MAG: N-acetyltransferase [Cytophagia bacterium]|nr:N-acetyltransferase [Cytophagia bacterium]NBW38574.1 N-acetyltransferase [Cytophagia bacterium]
MERMNLPESLESERLLFQRLRYEDAEEIFYAYASKAEATRFVSFATHKDIKDTRTYLRYAKNAWDMGLDYAYSIRLKESSQLIGSYGIINEMGRIQFGYILSPTYWGNGYATEACLLLTALLKTQRGVYRIGSFVDQEHIASIRVLEKSGFVCEGTLKRWIKFPNQDNTAKDCKVFVLP